MSYGDSLSSQIIKIKQYKNTAHTKLRHKQQQHKQQLLELQLRISGRHSMHCTLPKPSTSNCEEEDRKSNFQAREFVEKENINSSAKDSSEVTSAGWRDHDRRCAVYLLTPEPDGQCKLVALPLRYVYHVNQLGSTTPSIAVSSPQPKNGGTENTFLVPKEETSKKRNSGKKKKKKGKKKKKLAREIGKSSSENVPECGASPTGDKSDIHNGVVPLASARKLADFLPDNSGNGNCSEGTSARDYQCTSCIEEAGVSKSLTPSMLSNCSGDDHISEFGDGIQTAGQGMQYEVSSRPDVFSERPVLGSPSLDSNCEKLNSGHRSTPWNEGNDGIKHLTSPSCVFREECPGNTFHNIVDNDIQNQKANCSRQLCNSEMLEKRVKKIKRAPQNSGVCNVRNMHRPGVKENVHSVWQKVQNSEACKHNNDSKNVNASCSRIYNESKETSTREKHINAVCCSLKSDSALKKQTNTKVFAKTKRKNNLGSKQEFDNHYRNGSQAVTDNSDLCTNFNKQKLSAIPKQMNGDTKLGLESRSHSKAKFATSGTRKVEPIRLRRPESPQATINEAEPLESWPANNSSLIDRSIEHTTCYSLTSSCSLNPEELLEKVSDIQLHTLADHKEIKTDKDCFASSDHKLGFSSGAGWQKRKSTRNSGLNDSSVYGGMSMIKIDESDEEIRVERNIIEQEVVSDLCSSICAASSSSTCKQEGFNDVNSSPLTNVLQVKNFRNQTLSSDKEDSNSTKCLTPEFSNQHILIPDNSSSKLLSTVSDSHRAHIASEAIQLATGCPVAEFEKFLHSASPVICTSPATVDCQKCLHDISHAFLCQHEVPNISLAELWQWYEKHGSYGLEVMVACENSCRLGIDSKTFRAYFVPYLSAIQLFTKSKGLCSGISGASAMKKGEMVESSDISNINHVLSLLVPQPRESESMLAPDENVGSKPFSGSFTENVSVSQADCGRSDQLEILFEYFESEQPQRRRPLYDMINELVRGNVSSRGRVLGDVTTLKSASICDLHPTSWYSVAWYPIYRIPEGNFRAAFLTYHSLGHLVQRQTVSDSACLDVSVVSPVVGLQTYNTQGECWFKPRHSEDVVNSEPARILKERLRTLEQTASLMARAVVTKGNKTTVNRHPDYEFFLSRQSY
ncbi:hypothetical protein POM88_003809 [Heracleum sosnowskyi]|uniref:Uncharacterized protein n=1 Tax=Heracleum sosnowskyi TaxID=360622 RepID=A0AAD8JIN7_9APIA|nr:hypothetical protein POM88_003809 [Heracleum sosnowskyi]